MTDHSDSLDFADPADVPIRYLQRMTDYYLALGYDNPYRWAHYEEVPFHDPEKAVADSRVALITTAAPFDPEKGDQGPGAPYNASAKFYRVYSGSVEDVPDLRISHLGYDRVNTTAEDINTYFPLAAMRQAAVDGKIGDLAPRFHGAPTNRSQRTTIETDCAELLARCRDDGVEAAAIVAN